MYNIPVSGNLSAALECYRRCTNLWLVRDDAEDLHYALCNPKLVTVDDLRRIGYPVSDNPHADDYVLFELSDMEFDSKASTDFVFIIEDFAKSKSKAKVINDFLRAKVSQAEYGNMDEVTAVLPDPIVTAPSRKLMVCNGLQMDFLDDLFGDDREAAPFRPHKNPAFTFIDLFAGIGGIRLGFESVNGRCVFSSEFDEDACTTYKANFGEHPAGDITKIDAKDIPDFDILLGGFPCQAFSIIGKKEGFANETCGTLFFEIERILKARRPRAFMLENVRNLVAHDGGKTFKVITEHLKTLGYHVHAKVLNALDYGAPQQRHRIFIVGFLDDVAFSFPEPLPENERPKLRDVLEENVPARYYVNARIRESRLERLKDKNFPRPYISHENMAGSVTPHLYASALRAGASANYILINDERRPTEREMLRFQGFPENYRIVLPYGKVKKQCGNSVAVPVIKAIARKMVEALNLNGKEVG